MNSAESLAREYLRQRPAAAARILEQLPADTGAELLQRLPPRLAAPLLQALLPGYAARCANLMPASQAAVLIEQLPARSAAAVLRGTAEPTRREIFGHLPSLVARHLRLLLFYPPEVVGAWVEPDVLLLRDTHSLSEARTLVRESSSRVPDRLFVVDAGQRLQGVVPALDLLRSRRRGPVALLSEPAPRALRSRTLVSAARGHSDWFQYREIPVVNRRNELIGILSASTLREALLHLSYATANGSGGAAVSGLAEVVADGVGAVWHTWAELLAERQREGESER